MTGTPKRRNTISNIFNSMWGLNNTTNSRVNGFGGVQNNRVNQSLNHVDEISKKWRNSPRVVQSVNDSVKNINSGLLSSLTGASFVIGSGILISVLQSVGTQAVVNMLIRSGAMKFISNTAYSAISATPWALSKIGNISCWGAKGFYSLTRVGGNYGWIAINLVGGKVAIWSLKFIGKYGVRLGIPTGISAWLAGFAEDLEDVLNIANLLDSNAKANKDANFTSSLINEEVANELMTFHSTLGAVTESQARVAEELAKMKVESSSPDFATTVAATAVENAVNDGGSWWLAALGMITVTVILTPIALIGYDYYCNDSKYTEIAGVWIAQKAEEIYNLIPEAWRFWKSVKEDDLVDFPEEEVKLESLKTLAEKKVPFEDRIKMETMGLDYEEYYKWKITTEKLENEIYGDDITEEEAAGVFNNLREGGELAAEPENVD